MYPKLPPTPKIIFPLPFQYINLFIYLNYCTCWFLHWLMQISEKQCHRYTKNTLLYAEESQNVCCWLFSSPESIYPEGLINSSRFKHLWFTTEQHIPIHSYNSQAKNTCSLKFSILSSQKTDGQTWFFIENSSDGNFIDVHNVARGHSVKNMCV